MNTNKKMNQLRYSCLFVSLLFLSFTFVKAQDNTLTRKEKKEGWQLLFDGKNTSLWKGAFIPDFPTKGWHIENGLLTVEDSGGKESTNGGDIITKEQFSDFELSVDFKITKGANSGIKYFVDPNQPVPKNLRSAFGLEYQILDDKNHPDALLGHNGDRKLGSLYDLIPAPENKPFRGIGTWNTARIISKGKHVEHWLNGVKLIEYDRGSQDFNDRIIVSKYNGMAGFGLGTKGSILLQDHGNNVFFKNIKIKKI